MDAWLFNNLINQDVSWELFRLLLLWLWFSIFTLFSFDWLLNGFGFCLLLFLWAKDSISYTLLLLEYLAYHEGVICVGVYELDLRLGIGVKMGCVIISLLNLLEGLDDFTYVDSGRICGTGKICYQILELICQI